MADKSKIEWTEATWNPIRARNLETNGVGHYCEKVSSGCAGCYAERMQPRFKNDIRYNAVDIDKVDLFLDEEVLTQPLRWKRPRQIFPCSMTDLFGKWVPDSWLDQIFAVMALAHWHTFQALTKRPERMLEYLTAPSVRFPDSREPRPEISYQLGKLTDVGNRKSIGRTSDAQNRLCHGGWPLPNVWLGVSVEDQKTADERIPLLLQTPAAVRWLSIEPLLGPVDLRPQAPEAYARLGKFYSSGYFNPKGDSPRADRVLNCFPRIDWVVVGGESGAKARPMHPDWPRDLRDQCTAAGVPFFFKQWGEWWPMSQTPDFWVDQHPRYAKRSMILQRNGDDIGRQFPAGAMTCFNVGKEISGRILDGRTWDEMLEVK